MVTVVFGYPLSILRPLNAIVKPKEQGGDHPLPCAAREAEDTPGLKA
jgi:hypothetical protein